MTMSWKEWEDTFKPISNPLNPDPDFWGSMFETFGEELEQVKLYPPNRIWTLVDNNPNSRYLDVVSGFHLFNRMGYFVTEVPWTEDILVSNDPEHQLAER
jgi:hypothetical protein